MPDDRQMQKRKKRVQNPERKVHQMQTIRILADTSGWGHMEGWGWGMAWMGWLVMISIVVLVIWAVLYSSRGATNRGGSHNEARAFLDERYASGDINREEYLRSRTDLER